MPDAPEHLLLALWKMFLEPALKQRRHGPWQTDNCVAGKLSACFCTSIQDLWNFMISQARNKRSNHHAGWNPRAAKLSDCLEPGVRRRGARLEHSLQLRI